MHTGTIKFFNEVQGFGFIEMDKKGEKDVFFHFSAMKGGSGIDKHDKGKAVSFEIKEGKKGQEADQIVILPTPVKKEKSAAKS
jgi:CspA family cold shock protein